MYKKNYKNYEYLENWSTKTIGEHIREWSEAYGDKIAVIDNLREITFKELYKRSCEIAAGLLEGGIRAGDNIVLQMPNSATFVEVFFGCIIMGAIPILALPAHRKGDLNGVFKLAEPRAYFIKDSYMGYDYISLARELKKEHFSVEHVFVDTDKDIEGYIKISDIKGENRDFERCSAYETALLLLSGGTTGTPKLIPRTHADYIYNSVTAALKCKVTEKSVYLSILPIAHNFSLSSPGLLGVLGKGGTVVMAPSGSPDEVLPLIEEKGVTMTAMVPALIPIFSEILDMDLGYDISSLELLQVGGALLEPAVAQRVCEEWPCKLMQVFGTAEGLICFTDLDDSNEIIINYQGRPISPADEIKIVDNEGEEVGYGEYGELLARGPYTIDGYYKLPEVNKQVITEDGFYRTGDRATYDLVKGLKMGGRIKEQINRAGEKIMPAEIERYLCEHKLIEEAAVIGVPDEELGYKSVAFIKYYREVEKTEKVTRKEISEYFCKLGVAAYKIPDMVIDVEQWPVTSVGKIDKKQLIKIVEER